MFPRHLFPIASSGVDLNLSLNRYFGGDMSLWFLQKPHPQKSYLMCIPISSMTVISLPSENHWINCKYLATIPCMSIIGNSRVPWLNFERKKKYNTITYTNIPFRSPGQLARIGTKLLGGFQLLLIPVKFLLSTFGIGRSSSMLLIFFWLVVPSFQFAWV